MLVRHAAAVALATLAVAAWLLQPSGIQAGSLPCPEPPINLAELVRLQADRGPLDAFPLAVAPMNERALACFGGRDIQLVVFVDGTGGLGGTQAYRITPVWLTNPDLTVFGSAREVEPGVGDSPFFMISTHPGSGDLQVRFARRWVAIHGHFSDPASTTCSASGVAGSTPNRAQAIAICRTMFVLTSIRASGPPDTSTERSAATTMAADHSTGELPWIAGLALLCGAAWFLARVSSRPELSGPATPVRPRTAPAARP